MKILKGSGSIADPRLHMADPMRYLEFNYLVESAKAVITDSGGISEEASIRNVPCMTLRDNAERSETIDPDMNELLGSDPQTLAPVMEELFSGSWKLGQEIRGWAGERNGFNLHIPVKMKNYNIFRIIMYFTEICYFEISNISKK